MRHAGCSLPARTPSARALEGETATAMIAASAKDVDGPAHAHRISAGTSALCWRQGRRGIPRPGCHWARGAPRLLPNACSASATAAHCAWCDSSAGGASEPTSTAAALLESPGFPAALRRFGRYPPAAVCLCAETQSKPQPARTQRHPPLQSPGGQRSVNCQQAGAPDSHRRPARNRVTRTGREILRFTTITAFSARLHTHTTTTPQSRFSAPLSAGRVRCGKGCIPAMIPAVLAWLPASFGRYCCINYKSWRFSRFFLRVSGRALENALYNRYIYNVERF